MNTSNVIYMGYAFRNCLSLKSIDLSNFDTGEALSVTGLFYGCSSLESIELNKYIIDITSINDLFNKCSSLKNVSLSAIRVESAYRVFQGCDSLNYIDLSGFNGTSIKLISEFFPENVENATILYNSSIIGNIKNKIPKGWIQIDINNISYY